MYFFIVRGMNSKVAGIRLDTQCNICNRKNLQFGLQRKNNYNNKNKAYTTEVQKFGGET